MAAEVVNIEVVANFVDKATPGAQKATGSVDKFIQKIKSAKQQTDRLGNTNAKPSVSLTDRASSTLNKISHGLRDIGGKTFRTTVRILDLATSPLRAIKNTLFSIKGLVTAITAGFAANTLFNKPIGVADAYTSARIGFQTLLGEQQGQKMMDDLDKFAKETPFNTSQVIANAQKMIGMGWDASNIIEDMRVIGDAAAATGKGDEGLSRIVLALSQIKTKGKLSTEELNQLAEAGIRAKGYLAEGLGYGTGDDSLMALSKDLEGGKIGAEAAIKAIMQGMQEYKGMMDKTANETVSGLKSQIQDAFEINVVRRWGQGLQDGAKRGLGSLVSLLDASEDGLKKVGDFVHEIGAELSNWAADKMESSIEKLIKLMDRADFKDASIFGKTKIIWNEIIAQPFGEWWDSTGKDYFMKRLEGLGEGIGKTMSSIIKGILGLGGGDTEIVGEASTLGGAFAKGFSEGFDADGVVDAFSKAFKNGMSALFNGSWLSNLLLGVFGFKLAGGVLNGLSMAKSMWYGAEALEAAGGATNMIPVASAGGIRGFIGSTGTAMVGGSGMLGTFANVGYGVTGGAAGSALSGGAAAALGGATVAGAVAGTAGLINALGDTRKALNAYTENDKKLYGTRAAVKGGMTAGGAGAGALAGAAIGSIFGGVGAIPGAIIGAGIGGISTFLAGNKVADKISGVSKSTAELKEEAQALKAENMAKHFGEWQMTSEDLAATVQNIVGEKTIQRTNAYTEAVNNLANAEKIAQKYSDTIAYTSQRISNKEELSASDIEKYSDSLFNYASAVKAVVEADRNSTRASFQLLYGDDTKGAVKATEGINKMYTDMEKSLEEGNKQLQDTMSKAFEDGIITADEDKLIQDAVAKIKKIEDGINQAIEKQKEAETNAGYDLIKKKYSLKDMNAESYAALQKELSAQSEASLQAADDAYITAKAKIDLEFDGKQSSAEYKKAVAELEQKWMQSREKPLKQTVDLSLGTLTENYKTEFDKLKQTVEQNDISKLINPEAINYDLAGTWRKKNTEMFQGIQDSFLQGMGANEQVQAQMAEYYKQLQPQEEQLESLKASYEQLGKDVPDWITQSLAQIEGIELLSGAMDPFYELIGAEIAREDKDLAERLKGTSGIPAALKQGIEQGLSNPINATFRVNLQDTSNMDPALQQAQKKLNGVFANGMDTTSSVNVAPTFNQFSGLYNFKLGIQNSLNTQLGTFSVSPSVNVSLPSSGGSSNNGTPKVKSAEGRITTGPMVSLIGEDGPEAIIPLGSKRRNRGLALWKEAGRRLGVMANADGGVYGGSSIGRLLGEAMSSGGSTDTPVRAQEAQGGPIQVEVGGITIQLTGSGNSAPEELMKNKDQICNTLAEALQEAFQNLPLAE